MNCEDIRELSSDYLDQRLASHELSAFEHHLGACRDCRQEIEALRATVSLIGSLDSVETSADFLSRVHRKLEKKSFASRITGWLLEPIIIKVPLELTGLALLSVLAFHLYYRSQELAEEPRLSAPPESPATAQDKAAGKGRRAGGGKVNEGDRAKPAQRSEAAGPAASAEKSLDAVSEAKLGTVTAASRTATEKVVADDVASYGEKVQALLTQMGGRVLLQEGAADSGLLLTVELPQSRQAEFLSSLKQGMAADIQGPKSQPQTLQGLKKEAEDKRDLPAAGRAAESRTPAAPEQLRRKDEPMVQLQVRILPKH